MEPKSHLIVLGCSPADRESIQAAAPAGWRFLVADSCDAFLALVDAHAPAAVLIDTADPEADKAASEIRRLPPPLNGTPIIFLGEDGEAAGAGGRLSPPLSCDDLLALLTQWAGPLGDHALRSPPANPRYRLIRLIGMDNADAMFARFAATLEEAVALAETGSDKVLAHRLAGISGLLGMGDLHALWARVDGGEAEALPLAIAASRETLARLGGS